MKRLFFGSACALALLAISVTANPIIKLNDVANSSFHPAKMQLALPGIAHRFDVGKHKGDFGLGGLTSETGSAEEGFSAEGGFSEDDSPSDLKSFEELCIRVGAMTPVSADNGPISSVPTVPEPSTLALFGLFFLVLVLRSRWATWHR